MYEREGDALLAASLPRQSLECYVSAGLGLSPGGTNTLRLLRGCLSANPPPLDEADAARYAAAAAAKPACADTLCALLAKRGEGWIAEDVRARLLLESGKSSEAAAAWDAMPRRRRGPVDRIALSRCEALAADEPEKGIEAFSAGWTTTRTHRCASAPPPATPCYWPNMATSRRRHPGWRPS